MTPITQKFIQQSLMNNNLGTQQVPAGGTINDNNDGNAANGGKFRQFANGNIYWKENLGAHVVQGRIFNKYRDLGFEYPRGTNPGLGFPISDEKPGVRNPGNRYNEFEHGVLYWHQSTNTVVQLAPTRLSHFLLELQVTQIIQTALAGTMISGITVGVSSIQARIRDVQPYQYHQLSYPEGGRPFDVFSNRRYHITFDIPVSGNGPFGPISGTIGCQIYLEFKTNVLGQLVFVLRDFRASVNVPLGFVIQWCIGGGIDDNILPLCNQESVIDISSFPIIPAGSRLLCAHINTPSDGVGNPHDLLLYIEPSS